MSLFTNFIDTATKSIIGLFTSKEPDTVPFSPIPIDVIPLFFTFLAEQDKAKLGQVCKALNAVYLKVSPIGQGCEQLYAYLKHAAAELTKATHEQHQSPQLLLKAQEESANFYNNFSLSLTTLPPKCCGYFAALANQMITSSLKNANVDREKTDTIAQEFNQKIFYDLCSLYASQPIGTITIESFKAEVAFLKQWFRCLDTVDIEAELRKGIKAKHDSTYFNILRAEFLDPAADSEHFVTIRDDLKTKLIAEKNALQSEVETLRGSNGFNGTVDAAFQERQNAEAEMKQAYNALFVAFQQPDGLAGNDKEATVANVIAFLGGASSTFAGSSIPTIAHLLNAYQQKAQAFKEKSRTYNALAARLNEIVQYTGPNVTGGRLHAIEASLQPAALDLAARRKATNTAGFYNELNQIVGDHNKFTRSKALHAIID